MNGINGIRGGGGAPPPVVVGTDGSSGSLSAVGWAAREARRRGRELVLVHVWIRHPRQGREEPANAAQRNLARRVLRQALERARTTVPGLPVRTLELPGPAVEALNRAAADSELLVLGARGLRGLTGFLAGSVALGVAARAERPVVLVHPGDDTREGPSPVDDGPARRSGRHDRYHPRDRRDVVLGVDQRLPGEDPVLEFAFESARLSGGRLRVVHLWKPPAGSLGATAVPAARTAYAAQAVQAARTTTHVVRAARTGQPARTMPGVLAAQAAQAMEPGGLLTFVPSAWRDKYPGVEVRESVVEGGPRAGLARAASGAGLLIVSRRHGTAPALARTGPVAHAAINHVGCPVAVVPHQ